MKLVLGVGAVVLVLASLAAIAARGPRDSAAEPRGRLLLEGLVVLGVFVLAAVAVVALRD